MFRSITAKVSGVGALLVLAGLLGASCAARPGSLEMTADRKMAYRISEGDSRTRVEAALGIPTDIGETKDGKTYAHYKFDGGLRSVVYDGNDRVVVAYP